MKLGHVHLRASDLDTEGNGVELYYDRPRDQWFNADGTPVLRNAEIDPHDLP